MRRKGIRVKRREESRQRSGRGARAGEPREPTGTERRGASMAAKGAEGITGQVEIGRMALNTRRPTIAAQAGVQDVMADRVTKLG